MSEQPCMKCAELRRTLELERVIAEKIAAKCDMYFLQLQAIREAVFDDCFSLTAEIRDENLEALAERE